MEGVETKWQKFVSAGKDLLTPEKKQVKQVKEENTEARYRSGTLSNSIFSIPFDGEKNLGEIGPIKEYDLDYDLLRLRSWQSYLESEITQTILNKYTKWIVGGGLKLQSEPNKTILETQGIKLDAEKFTKNVEALFGLYANSTQADFAGMNTLNSIAKTNFINTKAGGDVLVVNRLVKGVTKVQLIDGEHVRDSIFGCSSIPQKLPNGNVQINGIEMNARGEHIAYHVMNVDQKTERIKAKTSTGMMQAFLVYGSRYRLNNHRGIPLFTVCLETLKKLERYKEATVGSAEERQKIAYWIKHGTGSTGEHPMSKQLVKAFDSSRINSDLPKDSKGDNLANLIQATTNKQTINMEVDSSLEQLESRNELYFKDFYGVLTDIAISSVGMPPEVATSKYHSNYSASRAATKDWEHTIFIERDDFTQQFYKKIYVYWLETNILQNNIDAPGYLTSPQGSLIRQAYQSCRFLGPGVPHIDPLKEVMAERAKLGPAGAQFPLTTTEKATESLNTGDYEQNLMKFIQEVEDFRKAGVEVTAPPPAPVTNE